MKKLFILLTIALPLTFAACGDDEEVQGPSLPEGNVNKNIVGNNKSVERLEMPHLNAQYDYIVHSTSDGTVNYAMEYDKANLQARWVAYTYDNKTAQKTYSTRTDAWAPEPFYNNQKQYQVASHVNGEEQYFPGHNRGHIIGSAERYYSKEANEQTFYMSNMSPMLKNFNSIYWGKIEDAVRDEWGRKVTDSKSDFYKGTLYVVKGGTILNNKRRTITVRNTLGQSVNMAVPNYFWIACLFVSQTGNAKAIGFWMEHKDFGNTSNSFLTSLAQSSACDINELERRTGIDFFCNLPDNIEDIIESTYDIKSWPGL